MLFSFFVFKEPYHTPYHTPHHTPYQPPYHTPYHTPYHSPFMDTNLFYKKPPPASETDICENSERKPQYLRQPMATKRYNSWCFNDFTPLLIVETSTCKNTKWTKLENNFRKKEEQYKNKSNNSVLENCCKQWKNKQYEFGF